MINATEIQTYETRPDFEPLPRRSPGTQSWVTCKHCSRWFAALNNKLRVGRSKFCAHRCYAAHAIATGSQRRENNPAWIGGKAKHKRGTPTYRIWAGMINRCENQNEPGYKHYGGRGIRVCDRWRHDFPAFLADMGERPPGLSIDRIDNERGYEPDNCRWATNTEQRRNRRDSKLTRAKADEIRRRVNAGESPTHVGREFSITGSTAQKIASGHIWK